VELVYLLQIGPTGPGLLRLGACTALSALLCHYCSLLLREAGVPKRRASREADGLRRRLRMSADALRALYESFGPPQQPKDENPAVIFDRAAEVVCRECSIRDVCWNREYVSTFNAFNDATPVLLERGRAEPGDFSSHFGSRCIHFPQLLAAINTEVTALLLRRQYRRQLEHARGEMPVLDSELNWETAELPLPPHPRHSAWMRRRGLALDHIASLGMLAMTLAFALRILVF